MTTAKARYEPGKAVHDAERITRTREKQVQMPTLLDFADWLFQVSEDGAWW